MRRAHSTFMAVAALTMLVAGGLATAAEKKMKSDLGKIEYTNSCAFCHGADGKGSGGINDLLKKSPPDLTTLSKKNKGIFPFDRVYAVIDGREAVKAHGERDMPAWGSRYSSDSMKAAEYYMDVPYDAEMYARARILSLIDYLNRMQVK